VRSANGAREGDCAEGPCEMAVAVRGLELTFTITRPPSKRDGSRIWWSALHRKCHGAWHDFDSLQLAEGDPRSEGITLCTDSE
jgi:hypothetical protein